MRVPVLACVCARACCTQVVYRAVEPGGAEVADAGAERVLVRGGDLHIPGEAEGEWLYYYYYY